MKATISNSGIGIGEVHELARRGGDGIDVALFWDSGADRVFVVVDDERRDERFRIAVLNGNALDVFHHPYAYRGGGEHDQHTIDLVPPERVA